MGTSSVASCAALLLAVAPRVETASSGNVGLCNPHGWCPPILNPWPGQTAHRTTYSPNGKLQKRGPHFWRARASTTTPIYLAWSNQDAPVADLGLVPPARLSTLAIAKKTFRSQSHPCPTPSPNPIIAPPTTTKITLPTHTSLRGPLQIHYSTCPGQVGVGEWAGGATLQL